VIRSAGDCQTGRIAGGDSRSIQITASSGVFLLDLRNELLKNARGRVSMAHPRVLEVLWTHLRDRERGEGYRESIYVDAVGLPTVGTGMMLRQESQVTQFAWFQRGSNAPVPDSEVVRVWRPFRPVGDRGASQAGLDAVRDRGQGATVIPQYRTNETSIHSVFETLADICETRAIEAMTRATWEASPADAQFSILLHLWRAPNELVGGWPNFRSALQRRDWLEASEECTWHRMRWRRRDDLQLGFHNAARVEQAHEEYGANKQVLYFPGVCPLLSRGRWEGVEANAVRP
jgi:hypothetical protein